MAAYLEFNFKIKPLQPWNEILMAELIEIGFDSFTEEYDGVFKNISYRHIAILPPNEGRLGSDVRVYNSKEEDKNMNENLIKELQDQLNELTEKLNKMVEEKQDLEKESL